ncbi:helix-turn-helix transcriptional regulator [Pelomonas sp. APW6]|uniref:Helix-turn-helix transcriptional regulator n=1 Tax=Roseateles subflavus TaxID=3053353 RepID=A0ABT7LQW2_9BURK|nr:helix-turn-helix transcriptional regulator [Pelomonas sp. APW6]MDL5034617.1 helix-turn-helix transcriptional regulator [Pelomonas sp. APW6]
MSKEIDTSLNEEQSAANNLGHAAADSQESPHIGGDASLDTTLSYENMLAQVTAGMNPAPVVRYEPMVQQGRVFLVKDILKSLRNEKLQTQEEMAEACQQGRFRVSIASIKRAEIGRPVLFRIARELARYFNVPVERIVKMRPVTVAEYLAGETKH